jgi:predicted dehydrogenase
MRASVIRLGIVGCGIGARVHLDRFMALNQVEIAGCADVDLSAAQAMADRARVRAGAAGTAVAAFGDHRELLQQAAPDAIAIFTPPLSHFRLVMDALQAGCHVFINKPLSTNVQEAADIVRLASARDLKVEVNRPLRECSSLVEARRRLSAGAIGAVSLVTATVTRPSSATSNRATSNREVEPSGEGAGVLADAGDDLVDALLWTVGQAAHEAAAFQKRSLSGIDEVTAAAIRLADGTPVAIAISGQSASAHFALDYHGALGRLRVTDQTIEEYGCDLPPRSNALPASGATAEGNFVAALAGASQLRCPANEASAAVRLLDAISRSAATGQIVRLV